jgi:hypothetical protein
VISEEEGRKSEKMFFCDENSQHMLNSSKAYTHIHTHIKSIQFGFFMFQGEENIIVRGKKESDEEEEKMWAKKDGKKNRNHP